MIVDVQGMGTVEFPDSMSEGEVRQVLAKKYPQPGQVGVLPGGTRVITPPERHPQVEPLMFAPKLGAFSPVVQPNPRFMAESAQRDPSFTGGFGRGMLGLEAGGTTPAFALLPGVGEVPGVGPTALRLALLGLSGKMGFDVGEQLKQQGITPSSVGEALPQLGAALGAGFSGAHGFVKPVIPEGPALLGEGIRTVKDLSPEVMDLPPRTGFDVRRPELVRPSIVPPERQLPEPQKMLPAPPSRPQSGQAPGEAATFSELSKKVTRTPEEETRFQELKAKSEAANKAMAAQFAAKLKPVTAQARVDIQHDLLGAAQAIKAGQQLNRFSPEQVNQLKQEGDALFLRLTRGEDVSKEATAFRDKVQQSYASAIRTHKGVVPPAGQVPQGGQVYSGGDIQQAAPGAQPRGVPQEARGVQQAQTQTQGEQALPILQEPGLQRPGGGGARPGDRLSTTQAPYVNPTEQARLDKSPKENMVPEVVLPNGKVATGVQGQSHADILVENGFKPEDVPHEDPRRRFRLGNKSLTRKGAAKLLGVKGTAAAGGLDSMDLPGAKTLTQPSSIGAGIKAALEKRKPDESGMVNVQAVVDEFNHAKKKLAAGLATRDIKKDVVRDKDAADNAAVIIGQRARTGQEALAKVLFGPVFDRALRAVTAAVETKGDPAELDRFIGIAQAKGDVEGLANARFAKANWSKLQPLVQRANKLNDLVFNEATKEGVNVDYREGYMRHLYDLSKLPQTLVDQFFGGPTGMGGRGYKRERKFDTLYDAIDVGYGNAIRTWNSAELLENRLKRGFQEINDLQWAKSFAGVKDPTTGKAVISLEEKPGYSLFSDLGPRFWVHRGYENVFDAAAGTSAIRQFELAGLPMGQALMKGVGTGKHALLFFDTYHFFRIAAKEMALTGRPGYKRGLALLEYNPGDLANAVRAGDVTPEMAAWANANRPKAALLIKNGYNVARVQEALDNDLWKKVPFLGGGTKWIFEKFTRGAMLESGVKEFDRVKAQNPGMTDDDVAKRVARDLNFNFGNIGRQGLLRSKTSQDLSRLVFLAPSWFESMAQTEARSIGQFAKIPVTRKVGTLAKGTGVLLLAMFAATQLANIATKGKPTWDNPEGHKMDAFVPGVGKNDPGFYVSPFSVPMEITHDIIRYTEKGETPLQVGSQIIGNKESPLARAIRTGVEGRDYQGRPLTDKQRIEQSLGSLLPVPLPMQATLKGPEQLQRQAMAMLGVKAEPAGTAEQQVWQMASRFAPKESVEPPSQYRGLREALRNDELTKAKEEYDKLVKSGKEPKIIERYFRDLPDELHVGSNKKEQAFYDSLDEAQKKVYDQARQERKQISDRFSEVVGHGFVPKKKRRFSAFDFER